MGSTGDKEGVFTDISVHWSRFDFWESGLMRGVEGDGAYTGTILPYEALQAWQMVCGVPESLQSSRATFCEYPLLP